MPGYTGFVNHHPHPGEKPLYVCPETFPHTEEYGIIALFPGPKGEGWVFLLSGGTSTFGTEAAMDYATSPKGAAELLSALGKPAQIRPFEAILHVSIARGVPLRTELIAVHAR